MAGRALARALFYRLARLLFRALAAVMFRFEVDGVENVPRSGAGVVVAAHRSWLDPACVGGACPRVIRFMIMDTVYHKRWARWFYRLMGSIPISPGGIASIGALRRALRALRRGELVGIFPEGRVLREGESGQVHPGAAMLASRAGAPIIPIGIHGSARAWPHGRALPGPAKVRVLIGAPMAPPAPQNGDGVRETTALIERALAVLQRQGMGPSEQ